MFSSLTSASKIYAASSSKPPRQKSSGTTSRRKKKRPHNSGGDIGLNDPTLVSLIDHDSDQVKANGTVLSEDSEIFDETPTVLYEEDFPKESSFLKTVDFGDANLNVVHEIGSVEIDANVNECFIENDVCISENPTEIDSERPSDGTSILTVPIVSLEQATDILDLDGCSENIQSDADTDLSNKVSHLESTERDIEDVKNISEITVTENSTKKDSSKHCVEEEGLDDNLSLDIVETKCNVTKVILDSVTASLDQDNLSVLISNPSNEHNPLNVNSENMSIEEGDVHSTPISNLPKEHDNSSNAEEETFSTTEGAICSTDISNTSRENKTPSNQVHEIVLTKEEAISSTRILDSSKENDNPVPVDYETVSTEQGAVHSTLISKHAKEHDNSSNVNYETVSANETHMSFDYEERDRSPELGELSCTESVSCESKSSMCEEIKNDIRPLDICRTKDVATGTSNPPDSNNIYMSYSDLGSAESSDLKRCSSFPNSLKETQRMDRGTTTSHFPCKICGSVEGMDERKVDLDRPLLTSRGVSAKLEEKTPTNVMPPLTTAHARAR